MLAHVEPSQNNGEMDVVRSTVIAVATGSRMSDKSGIGVACQVDVESCRLKVHLFLLAGHRGDDLRFGQPAWNCVGTFVGLREALFDDVVGQFVGARDALSVRGLVRIRAIARRSRSRLILHRCNCAARNASASYCGGTCRARCNALIDKQPAGVQFSLPERNLRLQAAMLRDQVIKFSHSSLSGQQPQCFRTDRDEIQRTGNDRRPFDAEQTDAAARFKPLPSVLDANGDIKAYVVVASESSHL